ncbi:hypothetical protein JCM3775_000835 [Rhodotorula graminis]
MAPDEPDQPLGTSFRHTQAFVAGAQQLTAVDFDLDPSADTDHREATTLASLCAMLDEYQEQSYLLDPVLESLVAPLLSTLRAQVRRPSCNFVGKRLARLARLVYFVTKVRGAKTIVRFFPHEVSDLSLLVSLLSPPISSTTFSTPSTSTSTSTQPAPSTLSSTAPWELRYALLLWLSVCIRLPFALALVAPGTADRIERLGRHWVERSGREGEGAVEVLGRYFARADADLGRLVGRCEEALGDPDGQLLGLSLLSSLLLVLSTASPSHIAPHFPRLYALVALLPAPADGARTGAGAAKARAKLAGRLALLRVQAARDEQVAEGQGDEWDVPQEVEVIVGELIEGLAHPDSIPRYSAAKYLARLVLVLPASLTAQVVDAVLSALDEALSPEARLGGAASEGRAQGACLAVGEMARRGALNRVEGQAEVVGRVVECTMQALAYDHLTALHPIGSSVRDSASYVLWSLSRTLPASSLSPAQAQRLAECLLCTACLDREVSVRRAASAAWQEAVGRWGIFPHGIDILRQVDFFTVSVRHRAFLQAAVAVASFDPYREAIVEHLVGRQGGTGVAHYDADIRVLAAQALGKVVAAESGRRELARALVEEQIDKLARTKDVAMLHGVLLSLAALSGALDEVHEEYRVELRHKVFVAVCNLHPSTRSLARNHLVLSAALSTLASSAPPPRSSSRTSSSPPSSCTTPLPPNWGDVVRLACDRSEESVHAAAGDALRALSRAVDCTADIDKLLADLDSRSGSRQQAAALLVGRASYGPALAHGERLGVVVRRLGRFVRREGEGEGRAVTVEARRNGVEALARVLGEHGRALDEAEPSLLPSTLDTLLLGLTDYTTDQRGDVGSWVRTATVAALSALVRAGVVREQGVVDRAVAGMAKLGVERLDGVREAAGRALMEVWGSDGAGSGAGTGAAGFMRAREVWEGIASEERWNWRDLAWASERLLPLLSVPEYRDDVLEGAILSNTAYSSSTPLLDFALLLPPCPTPDDPSLYTLSSFLSSLYALGKANLSSNRLFVPFLSLVASLAETGALDDLAPLDSDDGSSAGPRTLRNLLGLACSGIGRVKNPARLGAAAKVATAFLALPAPVARAAAPRLALFLAHPQPWLRQQTADDLFGALSALGLVEEGGELERLLTDTTWTANDVQAPAEHVSQLVLSLVEAR